MRISAASGVVLRRDIQTVHPLYYSFDLCSFRCSRTFGTSPGRKIIDAARSKRDSLVVSGLALTVTPFAPSWGGKLSRTIPCNLQLDWHSHSAGKVQVAWHSMYNSIAFAISHHFNHLIDAMRITYALRFRTATLSPKPERPKLMHLAPPD